VDPLDVLGVGAAASPEEVAAAYRALAKRWHPDRAGAGQESARRMAEINAAYALLRAGAPGGVATGEAAAPAPTAPEPARRARGDWLAEDVRRALGRELLTALQEDEEVALVTPAATWKSPRSVLAVTDQRLLWLLDDAISGRVHSLRWRDVAVVEHRLRRPLRRTAVLRVETRLGRRFEWAELPPETARALERLVVARAGLEQAA
jgi:DnaJ domain